jgi:hypothetical protein
VSATLKLVREHLDHESNVYYNAGRHGLEPVAELDYSDGCYQFDLRVVWKDAEGRLWTARDSGCSCPSPFEDTTELDRVFNLDDLDEEFREASGSRSFCPSANDWLAFRDSVRGALDALKATP